MRKSVLAMVVLAGVAMAFAGTAVAKGGGNSPNAKLCQKGGWQLLVRADGSSFANEQDCVSYAARGGTLISAAQFSCQSFGGTFVANSPDFPNDIWACLLWLWDANGPLADQRNAELERLCHAVPGDQLFFTDFASTVDANSFCGDA